MCYPRPLRCDWLCVGCAVVGAGRAGSAGAGLGAAGDGRERARAGEVDGVMVKVMMMMGSGMKMKKDEAQALARSCASRPDFLPCDGSVCPTHTHGKCFRLHWCCHLGWCHCKYVYQPMTSVGQLPSTAIPAAPSFYTDTIDLSISLTERFLRIAPCFRPPLYPEYPRYCNIAELFIDDYIVKRINGKMCYVQRPVPQMEEGEEQHMPPLIHVKSDSASFRRKAQRHGSDTSAHRRNLVLIHITLGVIRGKSAIYRIHPEREQDQLCTLRAPAADGKLHDHDSNQRSNLLIIVAAP
uniref:Chromosome 3 open reading frame 70 n=1 Tax=Astyanax mexicanus TaxID=7994 RepID=W5K7P6_ASTMX